MVKIMSRPIPEYARARSLMQSHDDANIRKILAALVAEIDAKTFHLAAAEQALAAKDELIAALRKGKS